MRQKRRLQLRLVGLCAAAVLCTCAVFFLAFATYLALRETMSDSQAALATAGLSLLVALLGLPVVWLSSRKRRRGRRRSDDPRDLLEEALQSYADPMLKAWTRHHPDRAIIAAAVLGIAAGYSAPVRRFMRDLYREAVEREDRHE